MKQVRNEKGLTLVELLAVFVIGSIIMVFVSSLMIYVQKQYTNQSDDAKKRTDITIIAKAITKDIRFYDVEEVTTGKISFDGDGPTYHFDKPIIYKNDGPFIYEVEAFELSKVGEKITLSVTSENGDSIETEIIER